MTKTGHVIGKVLITSEDVPIPVFQDTVMQKYTIQWSRHRKQFQRKVDDKKSIGSTCCVRCTKKVPKDIKLLIYKQTNEQTFSIWYSWDTFYLTSLLFWHGSSQIPSIFQPVEEEMDKESRWNAKGDGFVELGWCVDDGSKWCPDEVEVRLGLRWRWRLRDMIFNSASVDSPEINPVNLKLSVCYTLMI